MRLTGSTDLRTQLSPLARGHEYSEGVWQKGEPSCRTKPLMHTGISQDDSKSHDGAQYFVIFIDDYNRKLWVFTLLRKHEQYSSGSKPDVPCAKEAY